MKVADYVSRWPDADQMMWATLCASGSPLEDSGSLASVRETTRLSLAARYWEWIRWTSEHDPAALKASPVDRVTLNRLQCFLASKAHVRPMTRLAFVDALLRVVSAAAPQTDWSPHFALKTRLKRVAGRGDPTRKSGRVMSSEVLFDLGLTIAEEAAANDPLRHAHLLDLRDGTIIAFLALVPVRRRTLAELSLGSSLHVTPDRVHLIASADMMKSGRPWETDIPALVEPVLRAYLDRARPALLARRKSALAEDAVWLDQNGHRMSVDYIGMRVRFRARKHLGVSVSPHLFRDAAATTLARMSPQSAQIIPAVLSHQSISTADRHYQHAQSIEAGRDYAALIHERRKNARRS